MNWGLLGWIMTVVNLVVALHRPADPPAADVQETPPANVLAGPKVAANRPATLVQRDMAGQLVRLDTRPEAAALELLGLDAGQRAAADKALADRFVKVNALLSDNFELFLKLQAARQGGAGRDELAPLMREFRPVAAPFVRQPLADQVGAALPEEKRAEFRKLVGEYVHTLAAEGPPPGIAEGDGPGPGKVGGVEAERRIEVNLLLREMGRALNAIVKERQQRTEQLLKAAEATPEQEAKIRQILRGGDDNAPKTLERSPEREAEVRRQIMEVLTPEQRRKVAEMRERELGRP